MSLPCSSDGKESTCSAETRVQSLGQEDPLEKEMTTHSSILAWGIPWTEEPGGPQSDMTKRLTLQSLFITILLYLKDINNFLILISRFKFLIIL